MPSLKPFIQSDVVNCENSITHLLSYAQQKLKDASLPLKVRAFSYLRICCLAMQKTRQIHPLNESTPRVRWSSGQFYLNLLATLNEQDFEWWNGCQVSDKDVLISEHWEIDRLLRPFAQFILFYQHQHQPIHYQVYTIPVSRQFMASTQPEIVS
jgi:hypothetical protein